MQQSKFVPIVAALVAIFGSCASREFSIYDDFLNLPKTGQLDTPAHREVREALLDLNVTSNIDPEQMIELIRRAAHREASRSLQCPPVAFERNRPLREAVGQSDQIHVGAYAS